MQEVLKIYRYIYNSENNKINNTHRFLSLIFSGLGFFDFFFFFCLSSYFLMKSQIIETNIYIYQYSIFILLQIFKYPVYQTKSQQRFAYITTVAWLCQVTYIRESFKFIIRFIAAYVLAAFVFPFPYKSKKLYN